MLGSVANMLEDGFKLEWAFFAFVLGTLIMHIGLLALAVALVTRASRRHFAFVPFGTSAAILLYVAAGGPKMLVTWLVAAALALAPAQNKVAGASTGS